MPKRDNFKLDGNTGATKERDNLHTVGKKASCTRKHTENSPKTISFFNGGVRTVVVLKAHKLKTTYFQSALDKFL
jgi:hypothetical protein